MPDRCSLRVWLAEERLRWCFEAGLPLRELDEPASSRVGGATATVGPMILGGGRSWDAVVDVVFVGFGKGRRRRDLLPSCWWICIFDDVGVSPLVFRKGSRPGRSRSQSVAVEVALDCEGKGEY